MIDSTATTASVMIDFSESGFDLICSINSKVECSQDVENIKVGSAITRDAQGKFVYNSLTEIVELLHNDTIIKSPFPDSEIEDHIQDIVIEVSVYRRLGSHERLVELVGGFRDDLYHSLEYEAAKLSLRCALNIKIIDFYGSSINESKPTSDRFALRSNEILWRKQSSLGAEMNKLFKAKKFPSVSAIPCGRTTKQCWLSQIELAQQVRISVGNVTRDRLNVDYSGSPKYRLYSLTASKRAVDELRNVTRSEVIETRDSRLYQGACHLWFMKPG
ncbi:hypothetical protein AJ78_01415 [Emergomyces pasteurianus Ep9510]|uniref:Uncharacterized protein n=1 Tax=Emergomyces pasteurianus Ep9510 TaxID=1447872 RepID=A0A1J9PQU0_9EURO|nr:hypothetical protein AJ78_01415 [Emergomyces pasteurianus Ep9510]